MALILGANANEEYISVVVERDNLKFSGFLIGHILVIALFGLCVAAKILHPSQACLSTSTEVIF